MGLRDVREERAGEILSRTWTAFLCLLGEWKQHKKMIDVGNAWDI